MLTPPEAFGTVESGIYRCAAIDPFHFAFIDTLGLRTIIVLNLNRPPKVVRSYAAERKVDLVHMGLRPWRSSNTAEWMVLSHELIMDAITFVLDVRNHPVLVLDATNAFIGTLRKVQHWNFSSILSEYRAFSGGKPHYMTELFLELLDIRTMDYTEGLRRRKSIEGLAYAAAAIAATGASTPAGSPSFAQSSLTSPSMAATSQAASSSTNGTLSSSPASSSINLYINSSQSSTSLAAAAAAAISTSSGIASPRNTVNSSALAQSAPGTSQLISLVSSSSSPVPSMTREHYSNVLTREHSTADYDYNDNSKGNEYPGGHGRQGHVVVLLPPSEYLPDWFRRQYRLWERDHWKRKKELDTETNQLGN